MDTDSAETVDIPELVRQIRSKEGDQPSQGKKIHSFQFQDYDIVLDREFNERYRISVFVDQQKVYGFNIEDKDISDQEFEQIWDRILHFLEESPSSKSTPETELVTSHFFGNS